MAIDAPPCELSDTPDACIINLCGEINIVQAAKLKELALNALSLNKSIRVDMAKLEELDVAIIQLLCATKKAAEENGLGFSVSPVSTSAEKLIDVSGVAHDLLGKKAS